MIKNWRWLWFLIILISVWKFSQTITYAQVSPQSNLSTNPGDPVKLQIQMLINAETSPITSIDELKLKLISDINSNLWLKTIPSEDYSINNQGLLTVSMEGDDNTDRPLQADLFDNKGIKLVVIIDDSSVELDLISQPFAIKSRISDISHNTTHLQGIPVAYVTTWNTGEVLTIRDGSWVPVSLNAHGLTGILSNDVNSLSTIENINDVNISGKQENEILKYNGNQWVNMPDNVLSEVQVIEIVSNNGYIKGVGNTQLLPGSYSQIEGIGGVIRTSPNIVFEKDILINSNFGLGTISNPISKIRAKEITIVSNNQTIISIGENGINLPVSALNINGESILSGTGELNEISVFTGKNQLIGTDGLKWNGNQLMVGAGNYSDSSGVSLKVNGGIEIDGSVIVNNIEFIPSQFATITMLKPVAFSNDFNDLENKPTLNFVTISSLESTLGSYMRSSDLSGQINTQLAAENLVTQGALSNYLRVNDLSLEITNFLGTTYVTETNLNNNYDTSAEITTKLSDYVTTSNLESKNYVTEIKLANKGYIDNAELTSSLNNYVVESAIDTKIQQETTALLDNITTNILINYVTETDADAVLDLYLTKAQLASSLNAYMLKEAIIASINAINTQTISLSELAGADELMKRPELNSTFMTIISLNVTLNSYVKDSALNDMLSTVALTGKYSDLDDAINLADLEQKANNAVSMENFQASYNVLYNLGDTTGLASISSMNAELTKYVTTSNLESKNYVSASYISNTYIDTSELTASLNSYVVESSIDTKIQVATASILNQISNVTLLGYVTTASLDAKNYIDVSELTTSLSSYVISSEVNSRIQSATASVINTITTNVLNNYVTLTDLSIVSNNHVLKETLTASLNEYVLTTELSEAFNSLTTVQASLVSANVIRGGLSSFSQYVAFESDIAVASTVFKVDSTSQHVGIGDAQPSHQFTLMGTANVSNGTNWLNEPGNAQLLIKDPNVSESSKPYALAIAVDPNGGYIQSAKTTVGAQHLVLQPKGGNVGIGTSSPTQTLDVQGNLLISGTATANNLDVNGAINAGYIDAYTVEAVTVDATVGQFTNISVATANATVGLFTNINFTGDLTKDGSQVYPITSVGTSGQVWTSDGNGTGNWSSISSGVFSVNGDDAYYTAGNVGVGTTTPTVKLDVNGNIKASSFYAHVTDGWISRGSTSQSGDASYGHLRAYVDDYFCVTNTLSTDSTCYHYGGSVVSDKRLKRNIKPLSNSLDRIKNINIVSYDWDDKKNLVKDIVSKKDRSNRIGVIAQELATIFPQYTYDMPYHPDDKTKKVIVYKGVKYELFGPLAIQGIKDLKIEKDTEIKFLKQAIQAMETSKNMEIQQLNEKLNVQKLIITDLINRIEQLEEQNN